MENCLFCKIIKGEISTEFVYQDDRVVAFADIHPKKPVHLLVIPKVHIKELIAVEDTTLYEQIFSVIKKLVNEQDLQDKGYKIMINGGGHQEVNHLHIHLMGPMNI